MFGPLIGMVLYAISGYQFMLYAFGVLCLPLAALTFCLFPRSIDRSYNSQEHQSAALNLSIIEPDSSTRFTSQG